MWRSAKQTWLAVDNEVMFFAVGFLLPGLIGLYRRTAVSGRVQAAWGCGLLAALIPVMMTLTIVHGRLAFPVYGIDVQDPASVALLVSLYYGGQHAVDLLIGLALILLATAIRATPIQQAFGHRLAYLGLAAAAAQFAASYPWVIGRWTTGACHALLAAWFIAMGAQLARHLATPSDDASPHPARPAALAPQPRQ